jgi:hypothetical protein
MSTPSVASSPKERAARNATRIRGSCLCGGVRFEITGPFLRAGFCHCSRCRKHSGAQAGVQGRVRAEDFRLLSGDDLIRVYETRGHAAKAFCTVCGSSLFGGDWPGGAEISVRLGSLDDDPGIRPQYRSFVDSKASWDTIDDDLHRYANGLPFSQAHAAPAPRERK